MKQVSSDHWPEEEMLRLRAPKEIIAFSTAGLEKLDGWGLHVRSNLKHFGLRRKFPLWNYPEREESGWTRLLAPSSSPPLVVLGTKQSKVICKQIHSTQMSGLLWTSWNFFFFFSQQTDYSQEKNHPAWLSYSMQLIQSLWCTFSVTFQFNFSLSRQAELTEMNSNSDFSALVSVRFNRYWFLPFPHELLAWDGGPGKNKGILKIIWDMTLSSQGEKRG